MMHRQALRVLRFFSSVHTQVPMGEALRIPAAKNAIDDEWEMRGVKQKVWDVLTVKERYDVIMRCKREQRACHFGTLLDLSHVKHSELPQLLPHACQIFSITRNV